ncbi:Biotin transporter [Vibrio stylophorae]|uniref:Biotin transporter n=1 Tax=Vibrio stylophorae TaxID=659351 RepID=A0ABM8ZPY1_9VIBR|nr:carboxylate/amino acid/amine transporter [Vibrio stylophorae]CAH0532229.1 Biotin transporter [Vibrio stylophorae]
MNYLIATTVLWAFSFSLISEFLAGRVDSWFSAFFRVALAALVFIPVLVRHRVATKIALKMMAIGGCQLGLMYVFYFKSFELLTVPEVLLFTVLTPIYVTLIYDFLEGRFCPWYLLSAVLAVAGAVVIKMTPVNSQFIQGFLVVQGANLCFAIGQVAYKKLLEKEARELPQHTIFGWFYIGAVLVAGSVFALHALTLPMPIKLPTTISQWGILIYLGTIASGIGYFLWNKGATQVNAGALAVMNNALVPAGLLVNLTIWQHSVDVPRLLAGGALILASLWLNETWIKRKAEAAN